MHNDWIISSKPNSQARLRLFCFPYAGGSASIFRAWSDGLPETIGVCAVELPGRGALMRLALYTQLKPLVEAIAQSLLPSLDKPFALFGHSMGALISFELARLLRREYGLTPDHLFVSGRSAPHILDRDPPIHTLPDPVFIQELRRLNGTPEVVLQNQELMQLLTPILRADFAAIDTYQFDPEPPLDCPITAFGGLQDTEVSREHLEAWRTQTIAPFRLQLLPGNHFFLHSAQPLLLQAIAQQLHCVESAIG